MADSNKDKSIEKLTNKINAMFIKITEPDYVMNNYYVDEILNKMIKCDGSAEITFLKSSTLLLDLCCENLSNFENYHSTVQVFIIRILGVVLKEEDHATKAICCKPNEIYNILMKINSSKINQSLRVALIEIAISLTHHTTETNWILKMLLWKEIINSHSLKNTVFVIRQIYEFTAKFLWKLDRMFDNTSIKQVLDFLLKPLIDYDFVNITFMTSETEEEIAKVIEPLLHILAAIVGENGYIIHSSVLIPILIKEYNIMPHLGIIHDRIRKECLNLLLVKLMFQFQICKLFLNKPMQPGVVYSVDDCMELVVFYFNALNGLIQRRLAKLSLEFSISCNIIWSSIWKDFYDQHENIKKIQNQLLIIILVPSIVYIRANKSNCPSTNERLEKYVTKLMNETCEHTARAAYAFRDLMLELDISSITLQSVKRLTCLHHHLNNEQANLVFQAMFYILKEFDPIDEQGEIKKEIPFEDSQEQILVITYVLDTILALVKNHNINWKESLEIISLYNVVANILQKPNLSCRFLVAALNIIALTIKKFLTPNLSLLIDTKPGSALHELGKLIYMKMNDRNWEVRDSALELLLVCTEISFIKFPPFQKQIMQNDLIELAVTMTLHDHDSYVQASALKCIGASFKVNAIWEQLKTNHPEIQTQLLTIMCNNEEGAVRKEACSALCELYQNVPLSSDFKETLYESMVSSAISDFYWEVQLAALKFWKIVINSFLTDQGMLDGTFPPVTFSRATRKIVTLNDNEIQKRLVKTLQELSDIGCLTVLVKILCEENDDVHIMESALNVANEFTETLNKYSVSELLSDDLMSEKDVICEIVVESITEDVEMDESNISTSERVIDEIMKANDMNLLASIYESGMKLNSEEKTHSSVPKLRIVKQASPYLFLSHLKNRDFKEIIAEKRRWKSCIKSLESTIDDVIGVYEINEEVNILECY